MNDRRILLVVTWSSILWLPCPAWGCRYNVREVGFADLGIEPYRLHVFVDGNTPEETARTIENTGQAELLETNVMFEMVDTVARPEHPALQVLRSTGADTLPAAILVSPDGQSRSIPIHKPGQSVQQTLLAAVSEIVSSPLRRAIIEQAIRAYAVILLIHGQDQQENEQAAKAAQEAMSEVKAQLEFMPKPIAKGPQLVVADRQSLDAESVLLWSLDLKAQDIKQTHMAVFYGKARWIGPMFVGEQITVENLLNVLFVVGADCECGFDHRWLQGTMLPARWGQDLHEAISENLGFDPESPMVKMEIASIVRRGMGGYMYPGTPLGYQELTVEDDQVRAAEIDEPNVHVSAAPVQTSRAPGGADGSLSEEAPMLPTKTILGLASVSAVVLLVGIALYLAMRRR